MGDARRRVNRFRQPAGPESKKAPPGCGALLAEIAPAYFFSVFVFFLWCFFTFFGAT